MKRRAGRGALVIIALMFVTSGVLRIGGKLGTAYAENATDAGHGDPPAPAAAPVACPIPPAALAASLSEREGRLAAQEAAIADRQAALALADQAITARLEEMRVTEENLRKTLALADGAAEADIGKLVAIYEGMKPKDAARLFDAMEADFAAGFLGRMRPDSAAMVLAGMQAEKAYAISAILAGRNAGVPKD
jgi:flagellar motility protein MotE (MotC chaperone)